MLNPEVLICHKTSLHWRHKYNKDNKFFHKWKTLKSGYLGAWGGGFNNQTGPILVHIYPLFLY